MQLARRCAGFLWVVLLCSCQASPPANPSFNDAIQFAFREFETEEPGRLAFALRQLEREIYLAVDVTASANIDRSLIPTALTDEDIVGLEHPDRDLGLAVPIALTSVSEFTVDQHRQLPLLPDQRDIEPGSPNFYERAFLDGTELCWQDRNCDFLRTLNDLTKENALLTLSYTLPKDYRWVDMALPDPAAEQGPDTVAEAPRWSYVARSWSTERATNEDDDRSIEQSYSFEIWLPRDGRGMLRDGSEQNADGGTWSGDSSGGGTLRMMALWAESDIGAELSDELVAYATRGGIDDIFDAQESWLSDNAR
jgi:hypothetical protein